MFYLKMGSLSATILYQDRCFYSGKPGCSLLQKSFLGHFPARILQVRVGLSSPKKRSLKLFCKSEKKEEEPSENVNDKKEEEEPSEYVYVNREDELPEYVYVERPPYSSYYDATSGKIEPASGARASIPGPDLWPEGTADLVRASRAPAPTGKSSGSSSLGKKPGSRRKKSQTSASAEPSQVSTESIDATVLAESMEETKDSASEFVIYQTEKEERDEYDLNKKLGRPHAFIDPKVRKAIEDPLDNEELWWQHKKPEKQIWSRWQRRRTDSETAILKAMADRGEVEIFGEFPTMAEASLYKARRHVFKEERLRAEKERLERIGPLAYYSEWVQAWTRDTSREAIQKHYEETGEDENTQLQEMLSRQTAGEYGMMTALDIRIKRDPIATRMTDEQVKRVWGGDPVYPTVNYIQDPDEVVDYRRPDYKEPTPNMIAFLKEHGIMISKDELQLQLEKEMDEEIEVSDVDEAMASAVDIGEQDDDEEEEKESEVKGKEKEEKITRNWSVLKSNPELRKTEDKPKPKKEEALSLEEAVDDSENLTDFLLDFDESE